MFVFIDITILTILPPNLREHWWFTLHIKQKATPWSIEIPIGILKFPWEIGHFSCCFRCLICLECKCVCVCVVCLCVVEQRAGDFWVQFSVCLCVKFCWLFIPLQYYVLYIRVSVYAMSILWPENQIYGNRTNSNNNNNIPTYIKSTQCYNR